MRLLTPVVAATRERAARRVFSAMCEMAGAAREEARNITDIRRWSAVDGYRLRDEVRFLLWRLGLPKRFKRAMGDSGLRAQWRALCRPLSSMRHMGDSITGTYSSLLGRLVTSPRQEAKKFNFGDRWYDRPSKKEQP